MINPGTVLQDRYLIEKCIGEGGMGAVYLAVDRRFDNFVAIKETFYSDHEFGEAFEREAKILNGLLHPVLPHVSDYFTEGDKYFLVMQFIEGEDASDILNREGAFPVKEGLRWTDNLLDALDYLHLQNPSIIHRDVKPSNLKITPRGDIFLLDFGLAKIKKDDSLNENSVFGYSLKYSPLEQIQGIGTDARSDIFALAATVYHLFTGKPPVDAIARASAIVAGKPDPIQLACEINTEIPLSIANVLKSALSLNAENRFASANAMRQALKHALQGSDWDNIEAAPEIPLMTAEAAPKVIDAAGNENFPALKAFAAESSEIPQVERLDVHLSKKEGSPLHEIPVYAPIVAENLKTTIDVPARVSPRVRQIRFPVAAIAALLLIFASASAFFVYRNGEPAESNQTSPEVSVSEPKTASKTSETFPDLAESKSDVITSEIKNKAKVKTKTASTKKTIENAETEVEPIIEEDLTDIPHTKAAKIEKSRPARKANSTNVQRQERTVSNEEVPDIESIFTGRPSREREEKARRRQEPRQPKDEMSEEEWREMQRQRRQQRRQNNNPIPF